MKKDGSTITENEKNIQLNSELMKIIIIFLIVFNIILIAIRKLANYSGFEYRTWVRMMQFIINIIGILSLIAFTEKGLNKICILAVIVIIYFPIIKQLIKPLFLNSYKTESVGYVFEEKMIAIDICPKGMVPIAEYCYEYYKYINLIFREKDYSYKSDKLREKCEDPFDMIEDMIEDKQKEKKRKLDLEESSFYY